MSKQKIMTIDSMRHFLHDLGNELLDQYQVWLSCDEEGNAFLPLLENPELSVSLDLENKRIILYPSHCQPQQPKG
jgi:hypothetical protein